MAEGPLLLNLEATAIVRGEVRRRELSVEVRDGEVLLVIRTYMIGEGPDKQKQKVAASLVAAQARQVADALSKAADQI
jgi:hypothetical protein